MSELVQAVAALHAARVDEATGKLIVKEAREAFEVSIQTLTAALATATATRTAAEDKVRDLAVAAFQRDGTKQVCPGVTVAETTKLVYAEKDAFAWALERKFCLSLDRKMFESTAKATMDKAPLPFVTVEVVPQAKIATDLSGVV